MIKSAFRLISENTPKGDQPEAIRQLVEGINSGVKEQVLLGITGSGKTFTIANLIEQTQRPTLVLAHNKTLAAQLYQEFKSFFPDNAVEYFVSYYDYYQPEAYVPAADLYIEKEATINDEIALLIFRHACIFTTDVIVVASVSCIYGLGDPMRIRNAAFVEPVCHFDAGFSKRLVECNTSALISTSIAERFAFAATSLSYIRAIRIRRIALSFGGTILIRYPPLTRSLARSCTNIRIESPSIQKRTT